jgi:hypothetical protein
MPYNEKLEFIEGVRVNIISWIFTALGLVYILWGIRHSIRNVISLISIFIFTAQAMGMFMNILIMINIFIYMKTETNKILRHRFFLQFLSSALRTIDTVCNVSCSKKQLYRSVISYNYFQCGYHSHLLPLCLLLSMLSNSCR